MVDVTYTDVATPDPCGYVISRTWKATDEDNNMSTCVQTITVDPAPQASFTAPLPGNMNIFCGSAPPLGTPLAYSNGGSGICLISGSVTGVISGGPHNACGTGTPYTETWTFTDACNRTITYSRSITVLPADQASFTTPLPGNTSLSCGAAPPTGTPLSYSNGASGVCLISGSVNGVISGGPHDACGTGNTPYIETWTFTDACGRTITHSRTISVDPAPQASFTSLPGDITIACGVSGPPPSQLCYSNGQSGNCSISGCVTSTVVLNPQACPAVYVETWTFTDACGRTITHSRNIIETVLWSNANIGNANGNASYACGESGLHGPFSITSNGYAGNAGSAQADIMHFIYTQLSGNGQIIARFVSATNTGFGGIMIRESLAPGSKKVNVRTQGNLNIEREVRFTTNASEVTQQWPRYHKWLRLDRTGNVFNMFSSPDGNSWWFLGTVTVQMNQCVLIGVFAEGINPTTYTTAIMDNIQMNTGTPVIPPPFNPLAELITNDPGETTSFDVLTPDLNVYPNPVLNGQELTIEVKGVSEGRVRLSVHSLQGVLMKTIWIDNADRATTTLDVSEYADGIYLIRMETDDEQVVTKKVTVLKN
jgi:hypothetical protein